MTTDRSDEVFEAILDLANGVLELMWRFASHYSQLFRWTFYFPANDRRCGYCTSGRNTDLGRGWNQNEMAISVATPDWVCSYGSCQPAILYKPDLFCSSPYRQNVRHLALRVRESSDAITHFITHFGVFMGRHRWISMEGRHLVNLLLNRHLCTAADDCGQTSKSN